jgi:plastocyanin domain-containing protein
MKNIKVEQGKQIIEIKAKDGYSPKVTVAIANITTIIKIFTNETLDSSSKLTIPRLSYQSSLPVSGITEIEVPAQDSATKLQGICGMNQFDFTVIFH